ncbi:MAG: hypothetical protein V7752_09120 [Halopseudomonas sp.]
MNANEELVYRPINIDSWDDLATLFGERGAREGCWCMRWRLPRLQFEQQKGSRNRRAFKAAVEAGRVRGILGYSGDTPVAWCAVGPREEFVGLEVSEILAPVDDQLVWSIGCFFIHKRYRLQQVSVALLQAAVRYIEQQGGKIIEGYPLVPIKEKIPVAFAWTGFESAFKAVGFTEVARRVKIRPIVRYYSPD